MLVPVRDCLVSYGKHRFFVTFIIGSCFAIQSSRYGFGLSVSILLINSGVQNEKISIDNYSEESCQLINA